MLARQSSRFELRPSRKRGATYKLLYYRHPDDDYITIKVDILVPGILNIPSIPTERIHRVNKLPPMPFLPLLLLKLQAWHDHRASYRSDYNAKQWMDVQDIQALLPIAVRRGEHKDENDWQIGRASCRERVCLYV